MYVHDVEECPRCHGKHPKLKFYPFNVPSEEHNHYATCPATKQPLVAQMTVHIPAPAFPKPSDEKEEDEDDDSDDEEKEAVDDKGAKT